MDASNDNEKQPKPSINPEHIFIYKLTSGETVLGFLREDLMIESKGYTLPLEQPYNLFTNMQPIGNGQLQTSLSAIPYNIGGDNSMVMFNPNHVVSKLKTNQETRDLYFSLIKQSAISKKSKKEFKKPELVWENKDHPINNPDIDRGYLNIVEVDEDNPIIN